LLDLVATPDNPVPNGATLVRVTTSDGRSLRAARFPALGAPRGTMAVFGGRAEFIEKYFEVIEELRQRGFAVVALDWRGQGGSERELANPRKGHIDDFAFYQRDLDAFLDQELLPNCPAPWFALAHSMGGAILLERTISGHTPFQRLIVTAPMIDIAGLPFPRALRAMAETLDMLGLGAMYIPNGTDALLPQQPFAGNRLTSDPARYARNAGVLTAAPELAIGDPTIGWVNAAFRQMKRFGSPELASRSRTATLLIACGRDEIVLTTATEHFAERLDLSTLLVVPGARHELLMERDELRTQFWAAFDGFMLGERHQALAS
jgi:lysophospholipase